MRKIAVGGLVIGVLLISAPLYGKAPTLEDVKNLILAKYRVFANQYRTDITLKDAVSLLRKLKKKQVQREYDWYKLLVDSLKANDAAITENSVNRVWDYKIGSLSDGRYVYARVEATRISRGGYDLDVDYYLIDKDNDSIYLGGTSLSRSGMPYGVRALGTTLHGASVAEDVQNVFRTFRVYELKDRYVVIYGCTRDYPYDPEDAPYEQVWGIRVVYKREKAEKEKTWGYSVVSWRLHAEKPVRDADFDFEFATSDDGNEFYFFVSVLVDKKNKKGYRIWGYTDEVTRKTFIDMDDNIEGWDIWRDARGVKGSYLPWSFWYLH